jgi:hypothetical protein
MYPKVPSAATAPSLVRASLDRALRIHEEVVGLEILVQDTAPVNRRDRLREREREVQEALDARAALGDQADEGASIELFQHQPEPVVRLDQAVCTRHARKIERAEERVLVPQLGQVLRAGVLVARQLDHHRRLVGRAHAAEQARVGRATQLATPAELLRVIHRPTSRANWWGIAGALGLLLPRASRACCSTAVASASSTGLLNR